MCVLGVVGLWYVCVVLRQVLCRLSDYELLIRSYQVGSCCYTCVYKMLSIGVLGDRISSSLVLTVVPIAFVLSNC